MKQLKDVMRKAITVAGRALEYSLTGESDYHITLGEFRDFETVGDHFKAKLLEDGVRAWLAELGIEVRAPVILEFFEDGKAPSPGEDCPGHGVVGFYRPHNLGGKGAHLVYVLRNLPKGRFKAIYGHELVHAWERENGVLKGHRVLREGLARWIEYKMLLREGAPREAAKVERLTRWSWGRGIRLVLEIEREHGPTGVVPFLRDYP
ncbi:MAG: hypothetical protein ACYCW6_29640 [Candidatus Xenobia bacterium]